MASTTTTLDNDTSKLIHGAKKLGHRLLTLDPPTCVKAQGPQPKRKAKERGGLSEKQGENSSQPGPSELPEAQVTVNVEAAQRAKGSFKVVSRSSEEGVQTMATSSSSSPVPPSPASERFVL